MSCGSPRGFFCGSTASNCSRYSRTATAAYSIRWIGWLVTTKAITIPMQQTPVRQGLHFTIYGCDRNLAKQGDHLLLQPLHTLARKHDQGSSQWVGNFVPSPPPILTTDAAVACPKHLSCGDFCQMRRIRTPRKKTTWCKRWNLPLLVQQGNVWRSHGVPPSLTCFMFSNFPFTVSSCVC